MILSSVYVYTYVSRYDCKGLYLYVLALAVRLDGLEVLYVLVVIYSIDHVISHGSQDS